MAVVVGRPVAAAFEAERRSRTAHEAQPEPVAPVVVGQAEAGEGRERAVRKPQRRQAVALLASASAAAPDP